MKRIIVDLDGTLTIDDVDLTYAMRRPRLDVIQRLREYRASGFVICIFTARNMRTYAGNIGVINVHTLPTVAAWLIEHDVPYDEILVGKPWCGKNGFYVDDRALRPDEFARMTIEEAYAMFDHNPTN